MKALIRLQLETAALAGAWEHCDQIANHLANLASFDRTDSFLYSNLLSTVLNELLEVVSARHAARGKVECIFSREARRDRIEMRIPVDSETSAFYQRSVKAAGEADVADLYTRSLLGRETPEFALGFVELAADYGARFSLPEPAGDSEICLRVEVELEDGGTAPAITARAP